MPSVAFNKFDQFVEDIAEGVHNLTSDTLKIVLTNVAPQATDSVIANITEIAAGNGYVSGGLSTTQTSASQTSGVYKLVLTDVTLTASGGSVGPFRYAVLYNSTQTSPLGPLLGYYDFGTNTTLSAGQSLFIDFDAVSGALTLT